MLVSDQPASSLISTADVMRGVSRLLYHQDLMPLAEVPLPNGRRADLVALGADGRITLIEVKVTLADLRSDLKWPDYLDYCDRFFWAVPAGFRTEILSTDAFQPERTGLIVADRYDGQIIRDAAWHPLNAARRRAEQVRFARRAARRLLLAQDNELTQSDRYA